jgi:transcriptional regulator with XRE-family HTH domain
MGQESRQASANDDEVATSGGGSIRAVTVSEFEAATKVGVDERNDDDHRRDLGRRIRRLRLLRNLSLSALAEYAGTSASFLSQLERGMTSPSISSLRRIAAVLDVTLAELFDERASLPLRVLRRAERPMVETTTGTKKYLLTAAPLRQLEVYAGEFEPGTSTGAQYVHGASQELFVVLRGTVQVQIGDGSQVLEEGDSIEYSSALPHRAENCGDQLAEVLWIVSPPTTSATAPSNGEDGIGARPSRRRGS